jgi:cytochrome c oxidase assembly protein subunit 11
VTIELDSNTHDLPWRFKPLVSSVKVHPGELTTVEYEIVNVRGAAVTGQAVPSYGPQRAGEYFKKIECFCFTHQTLAAGETRRMPVVFVVDPKLPKDVNTIAVSYTFFEVAGRGGKS